MNSTASQSNNWFPAFALRPEVLYRFDDANAIQLLPEAVYRNSRSKRIVGIN
jgi:hypothetical protein